MHLMMNNLQNVNVYPFGLSCERSMCKLTVPKQHSGGGTLRPVAAEGMRTFDVETALLDDYADQIPSGRTTLVKIDTEGYDFRVLKGARDVLSRQQIIVISEVNHKWLDELGESPEEMFAYMNDLGYEPYYPYFYWTRFRRRLGLRPITLPGPHHWFNVVFVRQREYDMIFGEIATHWSMF
jgi:FkbM family methyltransferase